MEIRRAESQQSHSQVSMSSLPPDIQKQIEDLQKELNKPNISLEEIEAVMDKLGTLLEEFSKGRGTKEEKEEVYNAIMQLIGNCSKKLDVAMEARVKQIMEDPRLSEEQRAAKLQQLLDQLSHDPHLREEQRAAMTTEIQNIIKDLTADAKYQEIYDSYEKILNDPTLSLEEKIKQLSELRKYAATVLPESHQKQMLSILNNGILGVCDSFLEDIIHSHTLTADEKLQQIQKLREEVVGIDMDATEKVSLLNKIDGGIITLVSTLLENIANSTTLNPEEKLAQMSALASRIAQSSVPQAVKEAVYALEQSKYLVVSYLNEIDKILNSPTLSWEEKLEKVNQLRLNMIGHTKLLPADLEGALKKIETAFIKILEFRIDVISLTDLEHYISDGKKFKELAEKYLSPEGQKAISDYLDAGLLRQVESFIDRDIRSPGEISFFDLIHMQESIRKYLPADKQEAFLQKIEAALPKAFEGAIDSILHNPGKFDDITLIRIFAARLQEIIDAPHLSPEMRQKFIDRLEGLIKQIAQESIEKIMQDPTTSAQKIQALNTLLATLQFEKVPPDKEIEGRISEAWQKIYDKDVKAIMDSPTLSPEQKKAALAELRARIVNETRSDAVKDLLTPQVIDKILAGIDKAIDELR